MKNLILLILILFLSSCAANKKETKKDTKIEEETITQLDIKEFKEEQEKVIDLTASEGPESGVVVQKKPRRALIKAEEKINDKLISGPKALVTINFSNTNLSDGLSALGRLIGRNIISSDKVDGYLNMQIYDQPWNDVFNSILEMYKLNFIGNENNGIIRVYHESEKMTESASNNKVISEVFNIFYETPSEIITQLSPMFAASTTSTDNVDDQGNAQSESVDAVKFTPNDVNKTLVVQGTVSQLLEVEKLLNTIDVKKPQVLIEAFIVEAKPEFERKLGTRLGLGGTQTSGTGGSSSVTYTARGIGGEQSDTPSDNLVIGTDENSVSNFLVGGKSGLGIIMNTGTAQLKFEIDAMEEEGDTKTLSNPKIFTVSGKNAKITQGSKLGVQTSKVVDGVTTTETEFIDVSLELDVTPVITGDGTIELILSISNDSITSKVAPVEVSKKTIDTNLILNDGDIAVVGGILTNTDTENEKRVPFFGNIPVVGNLFKSRTTSDEKTELLIFIAPRIV